MRNSIKAFLTGTGRLFDFSGSYASMSAEASLQEVRQRMAKNDLEAIAGDFSRVGQDIEKAMTQYSQKHGS